MKCVSHAGPLDAALIRAFAALLPTGQETREGIPGALQLQVNLVAVLLPLLVGFFLARRRAEDGDLGPQGRSDAAAVSFVVEGGQEEERPSKGACMPKKR